MRKEVFISILIISSLLMARAVFAYDDKTTHPALTDEAIDFYNLYFEKKLTSEEKEWTVQGSIQEDTVPRWINHFYDPIYKVGWSGEQTNKWLSAEFMKEFSDVILSPESAVSSLNWVHNQELQAKYGRYLGNKTWEKAIYEYVKNKNKKEAYLALGHVLHLLEDMAVPEHTRNDTHPNDSPYENYASQFTRDNFHIVEEIKNQKAPIFNSLDEYFEELANYSNNYFFSKDTINDEKYNKPKIIRNDGKYGYGLDRTQIEFKLVRAEVIIQNEQLEIIYSLKDEQEKEILKSYFTRLSRAAVLNAAGVINLFFAEAEKAEKDASLLKPPPENQSAIVSVYGETVKVIYSVVSVVKDVGEIASGILDKMTNIWDKYAVGQPALIVQPIFIIPDNSDAFPQAVAAPERQSEDSPPQISPTPPLPLSNTPPPVSPSQAPLPASMPASLSQILVPSLPYPGFGGGGSPAPSSPSEQPVSVQPSTPPPLPENSEDRTSPNPPVITSPNDFSQTFTLSNIAFSGTAEASSAVSNDFNNSTTTVDSNGNWALNLFLNQGSNTIKFFARDTAGNISSSTEVSFFIDSTAPVIDSFSILECEQSLSASGCLLLPTTLHLIWQIPADDLAYFELTINGDVSTTTATSTEFSVLDNSINAFSIRAKDISDNWSDSASQAVEILSTPVVINEIAWAGTGPQTSQDEWIELYNRTNYNIDISGWRLYSSDAGPDIIFGEDSESTTTINKIIPAKGYYLIERTGDDTVNDIPADWYGSFTNGLSNNGEILTLSYASTTIDRTILCGGFLRWCVPDYANHRYRSMEKINPDIEGTEPTNWSFNNEIIKNGKNTKDENIKGTPKARNSVNYLIADNQPYISSDILLTKANSPYFVGSLYTNVVQTFQGSAVLTIEPGVVIKFYGGAGMLFAEDSKIIAQGTADEPIVFTSFYDDEYGGNLDATSTPSAAPGSWYGVSVTSERGSVFDRAIFRYAGNWYTGMNQSKANLFVQDASAEITNSIFEYSNVYGLSLIDSDSTVSNNIFRLNNRGSDPAGANGAFIVSGGNPVISNNDFSNNAIGLVLYASQAAVSGNYFESNSTAAIYSSGRLPAFTNNSGGNNGLNAINIRGNLTQTDDIAGLFPNSLPYSFQGYETPTVVSSSTLSIEKGVIVKSNEHGIKVYGNLIINGDNPEDIVFTSLYDDSIGGDTSNNATSTSAVPGQFSGIYVSDTGSLKAKGFTMRYAGSGRYMGNNSAAVMTIGGDLDIANAIFSSNYPYGIYAENSQNIKIENSRFENHNYLGPWGGGAALGIFNSAVVLNGIFFANNILGVMSDTISTFTSSIVDFIDNTATTSPPGLW